MNDNLDLPEKMLHNNLLFDFYETLLTDKQQEIYAMHYSEDYSLSEIAESQGTTPQAVADLLKRVNARLNDYETKLGLVKRFHSQRMLVTELASSLEEHNPDVAKNMQELLSKMLQEV